MRKGGRVVCAGIHMSDIPSFPYALLWGERELAARSPISRAPMARIPRDRGRAGVTTHVTTYALSRANEALDDLRNGRLQGAAVLIP